MKKKPNYYAIITAEVRYAENLTTLQKLLFGELTALSQANGFAFPSNKYLADLYRKHETYISQAISDMSKKGYIDVYVSSKDGNKRRIYIKGGIKENLKRSLGKPKEGSLGKPKDNTTSTNIKTNKGSLRSPPEPLLVPIKEKKVGYPQTYWRNKKRKEAGKEPKFSNNDLLKQIHYFKDQAMLLHGYDCNTLSAPSGKMLKGFKSVSKFADLKELIDWWLKDGGKYADYTPDAFISESTVNKFKAQDKKNKNKTDGFKKRW